MTKRKTATPEQIDHLFAAIRVLIDKCTDGWGDIDGLKVVEKMVNEVFAESKLVTPGRLTLDWGKDHNCYWGFSG